jgi:hypothetical protein
VKRADFQDEVEKRAGPALRGSDHLKAAIYDHVKLGGPFYYSGVGTVLQDAEQRREEADARQEGPAPRRSPRPRPGAEAHFVSRMLVEGLKPWVEGLRQEGGFGGTGPPYPNDEGAAADYIERTSAADLARWNKTRTDSKEDHERINQLAHQLGLDVTPRARFLPYGRPDDNHQKNAPTAPDTFLFKLAGEVERMSRKTGLPPDSLTGHVLTDGMPLLPRVRRTNHDTYTRLPSGEQAHLRSVTLTFRTADLSFEELRTLYNGVKDYMGGSGAQAPDFEDYELWKLVQGKGGPPEAYNGVRGYWQEVLGEWNRRHPDKAPLKSWEGLQKRYRRVCRRLDTR